MKNFRLMLLLLAGIAAAVVANFALDCSRAHDAALARRTTLLADIDGAVELGIRRPGERPFRLSGEGGWHICEPFSAPAAVELVNRLKDAVAFTPVDDALSENELFKLGRVLEDFAITPASLTLEATLPTGSATVRFGSAVPSGESVYAAVDGVPAVFVVPTNVLSAVNLSAKDFRARRLVSLSADEVAAFDVRSGAGSFARFAREGENWTMTEPRRVSASASAVGRFLEAVTEAQAVEFVWPVGETNEADRASSSLLASYGLDADTRVSVNLRTREGTDFGVAFGKTAGDGLVYALAPGAAAIMTVSAEVREAAAADPVSLSDSRLFPFERSAVRSIALVDGEVSYLLSHDETKGWRLDAPVSAAADPTAVAQLTDRLLALRSSDIDSDGIVVSIGSNSVPVSVSRHALLGDGILEDLRSKVVLSIEASTVRRLVLTASAAEKPSVVVYDADRRMWNVGAEGKSGSVDQQIVGDLLSALAPLRVRDVVKLKVSAAELANYGLDTPAYSLAIDRVQENAVRRNVLIGNEADGGRYATIGSSDAVFIIDGETVRKLIADPIAE